MLVHASATLHWLQNWTMNWKIALGTEKYAKGKKKDLGVCVWSDVLFKPESNWWCDMTACVVYKSLTICEAQKEHVNMSAACLAAEMALTGIWIGSGLTQLRSVNPQFSAVVDIMHHIPSTDLNLNVIMVRWKAVQRLCALKGFIQSIHPSKELLQITKCHTTYSFVLTNNSHDLHGHSAFTRKILTNVFFYSEDSLPWVDQLSGTNNFIGGIWCCFKLQNTAHYKTIIINVT